ncbi:hypothetical protein GBF38_007654, partial [Nibea albiflora]
RETEKQRAETLQLDMDHLLMLLLLLWTSESVRLVGGDSRCAGTLQVKRQDWRPVAASDWALREASVVCRDLGCGSAVSLRLREQSTVTSVWLIRSQCVLSGYPMRGCSSVGSSSFVLHLSCSDSVRLVDGTSLCSGRLEVKSDQLWSSVCEADFDQQDAEVVCRELGCGAPSVLQGALYGEVEAAIWTKEFQCGGHESALLDCRSSGSTRNTCSPGKAVGLTCSEPVRLVGGSSRCAGTLEVKQGDWRPMDSVRLVNGTSLCSGRLEVKSDQLWSSVCEADFDQQDAEVVCRELGCGAPSVLQGALYGEVEAAIWTKEFQCGGHESALLDCRSSGSTRNTCSPGKAVGLTCSEPVRLVGGSSRCAGTLEVKQGDWRPMDSVRLVDGTSLCSGRLEVKSDQLWSSVCEADFDQQDAEVVCRELGCGAPSVLQGALYGEVEAAIWTKEFQCGGHESALLDCRSSGSTRNTCSPGKAVGLTCSEPVRLVGGSSRCAGTLEMKRGHWGPVIYSLWTLKDAAVVCRVLDCGSAVYIVERKESSYRSGWKISSKCFQSGFALRECLTSQSTYDPPHILDLTCSDSVRLVDGTSLCSGRLEVKSDQPNQLWSSVCEADFDQQDAEVVCRELGCGAPSVLQGALYGQVEAAIWTKEFQCGGHESALLDCRSSGSTRNTCSPGKAVGLTCSEPVRLVGGRSRCAGTLEVKRGDWMSVIYSLWTLKDAAVVCRDLDCGSAVSVGQRKESSDRSGWKISSECVQSRFALRECLTSQSTSSILDLTCSDSVRLVDGTSLCSGRLEVKSDQLWSSVCEADFDQQDAEVVCRELGCGAPSVLQGALYGEVEAAIWTKEFQCGGHESALLDCRSSGSTRNTCSPGKAVGLTCSEPVRLVTGRSHCSGTLEMKNLGDWKPVGYLRYHLTMEEAAVVCRDLGCGSLSAKRRKKSSDRSVWIIGPNCITSESALRDCVRPGFSDYILYLICSDQLVHPSISVSSSVDEVSEVQQQGFHVLWGSSFTISCSIQPQYPGGSFQLTFTSSNTAHNYTHPAVNHSAHFLFPVAEPAHQGNYSCVYHVYVFSHKFSSKSHRLCLTGSVPTVLVIRWVIVPLTLLLVNTALYFYYKASMAQKPGRQQNTELVDMDLGVCAAEGGPPEEEAVQGAD